MATTDGSIELMDAKAMGNFDFWIMPKFLLQKGDVWNMSPYDGCDDNSWNMLLDDNHATDSCTDSEGGIERSC